MKQIFKENLPPVFFLVPGSEIQEPGWRKSRIRDKHPGSATLLVPIRDEANGNRSYSSCTYLMRRISIILSM